MITIFSKLCDLFFYIMIMYIKMFLEYIIYVNRKKHSKIVYITRYSALGTIDVCETFKSPPLETFTKEMNVNYKYLEFF